MEKNLEIITLEEAKEKLSQHWQPSKKTENIPLESCEGKILGKDVKSNVDLPPFDRSVYDGYALNASETFEAEENDPIKLKCVGKVLAGQKPDVNVGENECVEISTGAPVPEDVNAVVMVEDTSSSGDKVRVRRSVSPYENIKEKGSEIERGEVIVRKGRKITPQIYGGLFACGVRKVPIIARPRVGVISSGEELVDIDSELDIGEIYDVNGPTITSAAKICGADSSYLGIVEDDRSAIKSNIKENLENFDALITTGGTSAGSSDLIPDTIDELGEPGIIVHGLAQKPGKPTFLAVIDDKPIFGLPGYPVSAYMVFDQLVSPYLHEMSGAPARERRKFQAELNRKMLSARGRRELVPVRLEKKEDKNLAISLRKGSGAITSLSRANGYFVVPQSKELIEEGETVTVKVFENQYS